MKMTLAVLLSTLLILVLPVTPCIAVDQVAKTAGSGNKKLLLFAKNPAGWIIVEGGGSGKLVYRESNGNFSLTAAGLWPRMSYALIRYVDAPPKAEILARGESDGRGKLVLSGVWHNWSKKFWLVAGEDVAGLPGETAILRAWRPERYLFEEKPLGMPATVPTPRSHK